MKLYIVVVTVPGSWAQRLAKKLLGLRVCACVNIIKGVESLYWWEGKIDSARESLLLIKTTALRFPKLKKAILAHHPYDVPEIVACSASDFHQAYGDWVHKETHD